MAEDSNGTRFEVPDKDQIYRHAEQVGKTVQPAWLAELGLGHESHEAHDGRITSTRTTEHDGHQIVIKTTYEIEVDTQPFQGHVSVDEDGRLQCHAIPYEAYPSAVEFVKNLIDLYPESFSGKRSDEHDPNDH